MSQAVPRSPLSAVFLIHVALEAPLVVQTFLSPTSLPFMQMTNTTVVLLKLYAAVVAATCIASVLVFPLPEFLPGKRALAIALCVYHSVASTILFQAPRFIPHTFGAWCESIKVTPENVWGTFHGVLGLLMVVWWQLTLQYAVIRKGLDGTRRNAIDTLIPKASKKWAVEAIKDDAEEQSDPV